MFHHRAQRLVVTESQAEPGPQPGSRPPVRVLMKRKRLTPAARAARATVVQGSGASGSIGALYRGDWKRQRARPLRCQLSSPFPPGTLGRMKSKHIAQCVGVILVGTELVVGCASNEGATRTEMATPTTMPVVSARHM